MANRRVIIKVASKWVEHFRETKINLCSAFGVTTNYSNVEYNVIATSEGEMIRCENETVVLSRIK